VKVAIYLRQSKDATGEELGVQRQELECRRLCEQRGYEVRQVITDNAVSATYGTRPGYQRLLSLIQSRSVEGVVVLRLDRLLRRLADLETLIELSEATGVQIVTVQGDLDLSNSSGRLVGRLLASVARAEMETKSERQRLSNDQRARQGRPQASRRPYGYEPGQMVIRESEAVVLREMGRRYLAGHSFGEITAWANAQGHRTSEGSIWYTVSVRRVLSKPRYVGIRTHLGAEYPAIWPAIFDTETWERLQLTMRLRREHNGDKAVARKFLLTGLVYCGKCGRPMNGSTQRDRAEDPLRRTYRCRKNVEPHRGCGGVRRNADALDDFITEAVLFRLDTPELGRLLAGSPSDEVLGSLLSDRMAQQARLNQLVDDYATGLLTRDQIARAKSTSEAELRRLEDEIAELQRQKVNLDIPAGETVRNAWEKSESDAWRRSLLAMLIKRIDVHPATAQPWYKGWRFDPSKIEISWLV
jgi:site-specific DNA recombinase